jgi:hypothetical protein
VAPITAIQHEAFGHVLAAAASGAAPVTQWCGSNGMIALLGRTIAPSTSLDHMAGRTCGRQIGITAIYRTTSG